MTLAVTKIQDEDTPKPKKRNGKVNGDEVKEAEVITATEEPPPMSESGQLLALAIRENRDIETLERLMGLQERYNAQQAKAAYYEALSRFQSAVPRIPKAKHVSFPTRDGSGNVDYFYAPLGDIDEVIRPVMLQCGLSKRWEIQDLGDAISVTCIVTHALGHSETTVMTGGADNSGKKNAIQQRASTITYLQRYTLIGALGLTTADDDIDGRLGKGTSDEPISESQVADLAAMIEETRSDRDRFFKFFKVGAIAEIRQRDFKKAVKMLEDKRRNGKGA
jgi:hypothetical protein